MPKQANRIASLDRAVKVKEQALGYANKVATRARLRWVKVFEKRHDELVRQLKDD